jgi:hypothetical protein
VVREAVQAGISWSELNECLGERRLCAKTCTAKKSNSRAENLVVGRKRFMDLPGEFQVFITGEPNRIVKPI